ncbi:MAG: glycosyltransferase, partial [Spirulinaceae cyanobacterium]
QPTPHFNYAQFRRRFAADEEKIVYYLGRMTHEKGISVLLNAAPQVLAALNHQAKIVIIGGGQTEQLKAQAWDLGIAHKCYFTGFMPEQDLDHFQLIADCAVFPSLYEPFGIVVLESFAARVPVVVSDTCGLPEVVQHTKTGIVTHTNDPGSLAWGILEVLQHPDYRQWLVDNAYADLSERFQWSHLAQQTQGVYQQVMAERSQVVWS